MAGRIYNNSDSRLYEKMSELDNIRSRATTGFCLIIISVVVFIFGTMLYAKKNASGLLIFSFFILAIGIILIAGTTKKYKSLYKKLFVEKQLNNNFSNVVYDWEGGFNENVVRSFGLCAMGNRFASEDYIRAEFEGIPFEQADVTVKQVTSTGRSTYTTVYFKGRMLVFDFPDKSVSSVQVFSSSFKYRGRPFGNMKPQKVEMEGVEFNKKFDVLTLSPHDAFYLLTPQFMEKLDYLSTRYQSVAVHICGNKVFVGFNEPYHNAFDVDNMFKELSYPDEMDAIQRDIDDIKQIITIIRGIYNSNDYYQTV